MNTNSSTVTINYGTSTITIQDAPNLFWELYGLDFTLKPYYKGIADIQSVLLHHSDEATDDAKTALAYLLSFLTKLEANTHHSGAPQP